MTGYNDLDDDQAMFEENNEDDDKADEVYAKTNAFGFAALVQDEA
jgi:hypothetical protein